MPKLLFDESWGPQVGGFFWSSLWGMILFIFIYTLWLVLMSYKSGMSKLGFTTDPLGGLSSGAALRFASASDGGFPGGVVAYSSPPKIDYKSMVGGPEPPVFYNIGDVDATRAMEAKLISGYSEGLSPTIRGMSPTIKGLSSRRGRGLAPDRWQQGFTDNALLKASAGM